MPFVFQTYFDRLDYWYPAIRYRKEDDVIKPIREKEKADWKNMSIEEKKKLYRYSFRQTLAEFEAPAGYWKVIVAAGLCIASCAVLYATFLNHFGKPLICILTSVVLTRILVYPPLPGTFQSEYKEAELERKLVLRKGQFIGVPALYDYEKNRWK